MIIFDRMRIGANRLLKKWKKVDGAAGTATCDADDRSDHFRFSGSSVYKYLRNSKIRKKAIFSYPVALKSNHNSREESPTWDSIRVELENADEEQNGNNKPFSMMYEYSMKGANTNFRLFLALISSPTWKAFVLIVVLSSYVIVTLIHSYFRKHTPVQLIYSVCVMNLIFIFDVAGVVSLKICNTHRKSLNLMEPWSGRVFLDIIVAIPLTLLYLIPIHDQWEHKYLLLIPLQAFIRTYRIPEFFIEKGSQAGKNQWSTFLLQYLTYSFIAVHTWTCIWYHFAYKGYDVYKIGDAWSLTASHLPTQSTSDWYMLCAYWSITMLSTVALGDLYPVTTCERIVAMAGVILGFTLTTIVFVGSLTSQFITITTRRAKYVEQLKSIQEHLSLINLDTDTTARIISYYKDLWYQKSGVFKPKFFTLLPKPLQMEICYDLNVVPLYSSLIFRTMPESFLRRLSLVMEHQFYLPGDIIFQHGQIKSMMVCISKGVVEFLSDEDDESPMISFTKGTCFSELSLLYNVQARCSVRAATYVECQVLDKIHFVKLMLMYPDIFIEICTMLERRINQSFEAKSTHRRETVVLNVYTSRKPFKNSIKMLKDRLRELQGLERLDSDTDTFKKQNTLNGECLDLYIVSEHIKKKTSNFACISSSFPWILHPESSIAIYWEIFMLVLVFFICLIYPYYIGFVREFPIGFSLILDISITICLVINLFMTIFTAVKTKKQLITNVIDIIHYHLNTMGFFLDALAVLPLEHLIGLRNTGHNDCNYVKHLFYFCKGNKLLMVWRITNFFEKIETNLLTNTIVTKIMKYCVLIPMICYWCGIVLYMQSCFVARCSANSWFSFTMLEDKEDYVSAGPHRSDYPYITSVYFATTLLTSVGYGDIVAGDSYDMLMVSFLSLYGALLIGFCIAEFSAVVTHCSRTRTSFLEVILTIDRFMKDNNMDAAIKSRIMAFYELLWQYNKGVELTSRNWLEQSVAPVKLRKKVLHQARYRALTAVRFFQVRNKEFIQTLTEYAHDTILPPNEIVCYSGTATRELYIIESGYCRVHSSLAGEGTKDSIIGPGDQVGLLVMLYGIAAVNTVVTITHCKIICIDHAAYTSALSVYPEMCEHTNLLTENELAQLTVNKADTVLPRVPEVSTKKTELFASQRVKRMLNPFYVLWDVINVQQVYKEQGKSYMESYKQFRFMRWIAQYVLMPIVIKPDGPLLKIWMIIRVVSACITCLLLPINVALAPYGGNTFQVLLDCMHVIAFIDMYLMFHIGVYGEHNQLIYHPYLTAKHYLKGSFLVDALSCIPWGALLPVMLNSHTEGHVEASHVRDPYIKLCIGRLLGCIQLYKVFAAFRFETNNSFRRAYILSVVQFVVLTLFFLNMYTTILIIMSCRYIVAQDLSDLEKQTQFVALERPFMLLEFNPSGNMICGEGSWVQHSILFTSNSDLTPTKVYLMAFYWATASLSGAGFGDVAPRDMAHMLLSMCVNIHGCMFFGYVYASIAALKAVADQTSAQFHEEIRQVEMFLNTEKVSPPLRNSIVEYWRYQWQRTRGWSPQRILGKLHTNLNEDAVLYLYEQTLREMPLFENVEHSFFRVFAKQLRERYFTKGYSVTGANEVINVMFIIYRGKVDVMSQFNEMETCMGPGGIFGNIVGANNFLTSTTIIASRNIDLLYIDGRDFYKILKSYPNVMRKVKNAVQNAAKDYVLPTTANDDTQMSKNEEYKIDTEVLNEMEDFETSAGSHSEASYKSILSPNYIQAWLLIFLPHRWCRGGILPDSSLVVLVDHLILLASYVDFLLITYQMAFLHMDSYIYICVPIDALFYYKLFLDLHTGYLTRYGDYVLDGRAIRAMFWSKSWERRKDVMSDLPLCYCAFLLPLGLATQRIAFVFLRAPQLVRITNLRGYRTSQSHLATANVAVKIIFMILWASVISHVIACLFFKMSCLTEEQCQNVNWMFKPNINLQNSYYNREMVNIYIASLWYIINLATITGFGDVTAQNDYEIVETIIMIIIIKFCTGLLIGEITCIVSAHAASLTSYDYGISELCDGFRDMGLSAHQMTKMWDYVRQLWNRQRGKQMPVLIENLPFRMHCSAMLALYGSHLRSSVTFGKAGDDFTRMLASCLRHTVFFPGNYIVQDGDADQCMYFIHRGEVDVLTVHENLTESIYDVLGPDDSFGIVQGLFVGVAHQFSFRARTTVDVVYLELDSWKYLLDFYPAAAHNIMMRVHNVYLAI